MSFVLFFFLVYQIEPQLRSNHYVISLWKVTTSYISAHVFHWKSVRLDNVVEAVATWGHCGVWSPTRLPLSDAAFISTASAKNRFQIFSSATTAAYFCRADFSLSAWTCIQPLKRPDDNLSSAAFLPLQIQPSLATYAVKSTGPKRHSSCSGSTVILFTGLSVCVFKHVHLLQIMPQMLACLPWTVEQQGPILHACVCV